MKEKRILVAYATNAGSTENIARIVAEELSATGEPVDIRRVEEVIDLSPYTSVVVGGPMIMGWHRAAIRFVRRHARALSQIPVAYFFAARSLTQMHESDRSLRDGPPAPVPARRARRRRPGARAWPRPAPRGAAPRARRATRAGKETSRQRRTPGGARSQPLLQRPYPQSSPGRNRRGVPSSWTIAGSPARGGPAQAAIQS